MLETGIFTHYAMRAGPRFAFRRWSSDVTRSGVSVEEEMRNLSLALSA